MHHTAIKKRVTMDHDLQAPPHTECKPQHNNMCANRKGRVQHDMHLILTIHNLPSDVKMLYKLKRQG